MKQGLDLCAFIDDSKTAFHAVDTMARTLARAGAVELSEGDEWKLEPGVAHFMRRGGTALVAFRPGFSSPADSGFAIVGAHTDSPCLKLRYGKTFDEGALVRVPVEAYGGPILSTWTDRPLSLAGTIVVRNGATLETRLVASKKPVGVIPSLAIHLNRDVNKGFELNAKSHLPVLVSSCPEAKDWLPAFMREEFGCDPETVVATDLFFVEPGAAMRFGRDDDLVNAPRIDDLCACHSGLVALMDAPCAAHTQIAVFFDHEEIGSNTRTGANSSLLRDVVARLCALRGVGPEGFYRAVAKSFSVSVDVAQGFHPSYADKYDDAYAPRLNAGPAIKASANMSYASTAETSSAFAEICRSAGVPCQTFMTRADIRPGGTIGPMSSAATGIRTVDVGAPLLSMHASRETAGIRDHEYMIKALTKFFETSAASG